MKKSSEVENLVVEFSNSSLSTSRNLSLFGIGAYFKENSVVPVELGLTETSIVIYRDAKFSKVFPNIDEEYSLKKMRKLQIDFEMSGGFYSLKFEHGGEFFKININDSRDAELIFLRLNEEARDTIQFISQKIESREEFSFFYSGGTSPGEERTVYPLTIYKKCFRGRCLRDGKVKTFKYSKIKLYNFCKIAS